MLTPLLLTLQVFSCFFLTGLITVVQVAHYPAFPYVDADRFPLFHGFHTRALSWVAAPAMIFELGCAAALGFQEQNAVTMVNLGSTLLLWAATFAISVPIHNRLSRLPSPALMKRLVRTNWIRTLLWWLRSAGWMFFLFLLTQGA